LDLQQFKGKLIIKAIGPGGSSQKLAIPWVAQVLQGGLEVNTSITHYCSPQTNQARNFSVVNKFKLPLAITNVTMCSNAKSLFMVRIVIFFFLTDPTIQLNFFLFISRHYFSFSITF